ncbi:MAG: tetratricopeptide repeat protein [Gammaproteobacteria bacterium]|nr:tetratricopeptide repeat protein [Gammaproteobacteria bacterium]
MKLIRHLLSHTILIAFIVVLILAYYYRTVVFSEQTNSHITRYINIHIQSALAYAGISSKPVMIDNNEVIKKNDILDKECEEEKLTTDSVSDNEVTESIATKLVVIEETLLTEKDVSQEDIGNHESEKQQENSTDPGDNATDEVVLDIEITEVPGAATIESDVFENNLIKENTIQLVEVPLLKIPNSENEPSEEVDISQSNTSEIINTTEKSYFGLINQARLAYQAGKSDQAISHYQELIETFPEDPNAHGELGNIYYSKGLWKQASKAYYQAAIELLNLENRDQLQHLHRVIRGLDPDTAKELLNKLED